MNLLQQSISKARYQAIVDAKARLENEGYKDLHSLDNADPDKGWYTMIEIPAYKDGVWSSYWSIYDIVDDDLIKVSRRWITS